MGLSLFEDNATNALHTILMGKNKTEARSLYDFLTSKKRGRVPGFDKIKEIETRKKSDKDSIPDITITFNNGTTFAIEIKTKDYRPKTKD